MELQSAQVRGETTMEKSRGYGAGGNGHLRFWFQAIGQKFSSFV
jgi:hypothetical protein